MNSEIGMTEKLTMQKLTEHKPLDSSECVPVIGHLALQRISLDGSIEMVKKKNLVVNYGTGLMALLLSGGSGDLVNNIALGSDNTSPAVSDTALLAELYRKQATIELGTGPDANKVTYQSVWTAGTAAGTIREAGLFDDPTTGNMFSRSVFADLVIGGADTLIVTWEIIFAGV